MENPSMRLVTNSEIILKIDMKKVDLDFLMRRCPTNSCPHFSSGEVICKALRDMYLYMSNIQDVSEKNVHLVFLNFSTFKRTRKVVLYIFQQISSCRIQNELLFQDQKLPDL